MILAIDQVNAIFDQANTTTNKSTDLLTGFLMIFSTCIDSLLHLDLSGY
jgi:hypothetical protein